MRKSILAIAVVLLGACSPQKTAQEIIDESLKKSGIEQLKSAELSFEFRGNQFKAIRKNGAFNLQRTSQNSGNTILDRLSNEGFVRTVNDSLVTLTEKKSNSLANAVNSVHYFSVLPLGLNDAAVHKKLLGEEEIKGTSYYKVAVSFSEEGGGDDFDDQFLYWFDTESYQLKYLAYAYHTNGGGMRFRAVKSVTDTEGIQLANYDNYKPMNKEQRFDMLAEAFEAGTLEKVSEIILERIEIRRLP